MTNFVRGSSYNLPRISVGMIFRVLQEDLRFSAPEIKGTKQARSSREQYGDTAVGFVEVGRINGVCTVKGQICPEHRIRNKNYPVILTVNEEEEKIESLQCNGCAAGEGGCKHAIAFLMWCHRRSEEPSPTEIESYWKKPQLAGISKQVLRVSDMVKKVPSPAVPDCSGFLNQLVQHSRKHNIDSVLYESIVLHPMDKVKRIGVHFLSFQFFRTNIEKTPTNFKAFAASVMSVQLCKEALKTTTRQSESAVWHELRYARVTASCVKEAGACHTIDGALLHKVFGATNVLTGAMARGKMLEGVVLSKLRSELKVSVKNTGLCLSPELPQFGASADGLAKDFTIEIKCPSKVTTVNDYVKNGKICQKVQQQMQLQMLFHKKTKGLLCIASPTFESDGHISVHWEERNDALIADMLCHANRFWNEIVFHKLKDIYQN